MTAASAKKRPKKKASKRGPLGVPTGRSRAPKKEAPPKLSREALKAADEREAERTIACPTCGAPAGEHCKPDGGAGRVTWSGSIHTKRWRALERAKRVGPETATAAAAWAVECPTCKEGVGRSCRSPSGTLLSPLGTSHRARVLAAKSMASKAASRPKAKKGAKAQSEPVQLELDSKYRDYSAAHDRPCPECGAKAGADCRVVGSDPPRALALEELGPRTLVSGMHAARRTLELELSPEPASARSSRPVRMMRLLEEAELWDTVPTGNASTRWPAPSGVVIPAVGERAPDPWLRAPSVYDECDIIGRAMRTTKGPCIRIYAESGFDCGIPVAAVDLTRAWWLTSREAVEFELREAGYPDERVRQLLEQTGWIGREAKRKSGGRSATPVTKSKFSAADDWNVRWPIGTRAMYAPPGVEPYEVTTASEAREPGLVCLEGVPENAPAWIENLRPFALPLTPEQKPPPPNAKPRASSPRRPSGKPLSPEVYEVALAEIRRDGGTQPRAVIDPVVVEEYAQALRDGARLPPPDVFAESVDGPWWAADGFHRLAAHELNGETACVVRVHHGGRRAAILYSVGANEEHGLRRTRADRRRAIETLLRDEEWGRKTDRWIAETCGVSPTTVGTIRAEVSKLDTSTSALLMREGQDGKLYPSRSPAGATPPEELYEDPTTGDMLDMPPEPAAAPDEDAETCELCYGLGAPDEGEGDDRTRGCPACGQVARAERDTSDGDGTTRRIEASPVDERHIGSRSSTAGGGGKTGTEASDGAERRDAPAAAPSKRKWRDVLELPPGPIDPMLIIEHHIRLSRGLGLTDEERAELDRARAFGLSQWQTMPDLADRMVELAGLAGMDRPTVLEPSAGGGALVAAVRRACGLDAHITAHEIDPVYVETLRRAPRAERADMIHDGDFFAWRPPARPYAATIMNSAYEGGADGRFLERAMESSLRVTGLLRLNALAGSGRHELVWSRVDSGEWCLTDEAVLVNRPGFIGPGEDGAKSDYVVVHLERASIAKRTLTKRVWWK